MRELNKHHIYSLFLTKISNDTLIFKNPKIFSITLSGAVTLMFFSIYTLFIQDMPDNDPDKKYLVYFTLGLGSVSALALFKFISSSEKLTIRKPINSITYEYKTLTGVKGWKRRISDFKYIDTYTSITNKGGGVYVGQDSYWIFELIAKDDFKVPIFNKSIIHIRAKNTKKALAFSTKIAEFMNIKVKTIK